MIKLRVKMVKPNQEEKKASRYPRAQK